jgi:hypothetical protein
MNLAVRWPLQARTAVGKLAQERYELGEARCKAAGVALPRRTGSRRTPTSRPPSSPGRLPGAIGHVRACRGPGGRLAQCLDELALHVRRCPTHAQRVPTHAQRVPTHAQRVARNARHVARNARHVARNARHVARNARSIATNGWSIPRNEWSIPRYGQSIPRNRQSIPRNRQSFFPRAYRRSRYAERCLTNSRESSRPS